MKKYLLALSAFVITTASVNAQQKTITAPGAKEHPHQKMMHGKHNHHDRSMMMKQINLSDAQKQQVKSINTDYKNQLKQLKQNDNMSVKDYNAKRAALHQEQKSKFESVLTSEQKSKMGQLKKDETAKREAMQQKRLGKMKSTLNLSDAQVSKLQSQHELSKTQAKAIRENTALSSEQKKEQLMDLRNKDKESEKNILTKEQLQKKEELKNDRMNEMKNRKADRS